jgi:hypothetical protein
MDDDDNPALIELTVNTAQVGFHLAPPPAPLAAHKTIATGISIWFSSISGSESFRANLCMPCFFYARL